MMRLAGLEELSEEEAFFTYMLEKYALAFSEALTLETAEDFIYLSDPKTYELYLISVAEPGRIKETWGDYKGKKCYEVLQNRKEPCPFCTNAVLRRDQYYIWKHHNDVIDGDYILKDKLVEWEKKLVRMEVVMDVSRPERTDEVIQRSLYGQNMLSSCMRPLIEAESVVEASRELLAEICRFYGSEEGVMLLFSRKGRVAVWNQRREEYQVLEKKPISEKTIACWEKILSNEKQVVIKNVEQLAGEDEGLYLRLKRDKTESFCLTPIFAGSRLLGFIGLKNITKYWSELAILGMLASYISTFLIKEELQFENRRILYFDQLTQFLNFEGFRVQAVKLLSENPDRKYVLWYSDLKKFKYINDVYGYETGDRFLKYWADCIRETLKPYETFGRISGDKFVVLRSFERSEELEERFRRITEKLNGFAGDSRRFRVELACGAYRMEKPEDRLSLNEMLDRANIAEKSVKSLPGSHMAVYDEKMRSRVVQELAMEAAMADALRKEEFEMYLQPQISLKKSGVLRAEALVRWRGADGKLIFPADFIDLFEREGIIFRLDYYMLEQACRFLKQWLRQQGRPLCISVNVSRTTMLQPDFTENCRRLKRQYEIPDGYLELEFTEGVIVENHDIFRKIVKGLQEHGFSCAMDDFGAEQSSLNILKDIPMNVLKFDRRFFERGEYEERGRAVVACMLNLAETLKMETVAEGVEDMELVDMLREMGCDFIQGYVYARPMPAGDYREFMERFLAGQREK